MQDPNTNTPAVPEGTAPVPPVAVNTPPPDEGVINTKPDSTDEDLMKFFGTGAEGFVEKDAGGMKVVMSEPVKPDQSAETPPAQPETTPPASETPATPAETAPQVYTQEQVNAMLDERLAQEVKKFEHINTFFEEYNKDPYGFMSKNAPHLFEKFNEQDYVTAKLAEEFGEFTPDPSRTFVMGTTDYNYRVRLDQLVQEAAGLKDQARNTLAQQEADMAQAETNYKTAKAQALGMDMSSFDSNVWSKIKAMNNDSVLDALVDSVIYKDKLAETSAAMRQQIDLTKGVPSPANVSGTGKPAEGDKDLALLKAMFGDEFD